MIRNAVGSLEQDLDCYPAPDFGPEGHWVLFEGELLPVTKDLLRRYLHNGTVSRMFGRTGYQTMTGRGCPHACTYCGNSFYRDLYKRQRYVRYRSVEHVMQELEQIKRELPFIDFVWFSDDSFFGRPLPDLLDFAEQYKRRIGDPFYLLGSPGTITDEKYSAMVDAGLMCIQMGLEHGSPRIQRMFKRSTMGNDKIIRTAEILTRYADRTAPPQYDVIYDLAYETMEDKLYTLRVISDLPKPYRLQVFSVIYYPGTSLHTIAERDGLINDEKAEIYDRMFFERHDSYTNTLLFLARSGKFPHPVLKAGRFPSRRVRMGPADEARPYIQDISGFWTRDRWSSRDGVDYLAAARQVRGPVLSVLGEGDALLAHPVGAGRWAAHIGEDGAETWRAGVGRYGLAHDPDHMGLVTDVRCRSLWEAIGGWVEEKTAPPRVE